MINFKKLNFEKNKFKNGTITPRTLTKNFDSNTFKLEVSIKGSNYEFCSEIKQEFAIVEGAEYPSNKIILDILKENFKFAEL